MRVKALAGAFALMIAAIPLAEAQPMPPGPPPHGGYSWHGRHYEHRAWAYDRHHHHYWRYY